jgi:hypothetical protein
LKDGGKMLQGLKYLLMSTRNKQECGGKENKIHSRFLNTLATSCAVRKLWVFLTEEQNAYCV